MTHEEGFPLSQGKNRGGQTTHTKVHSLGPDKREPHSFVSGIGSLPGTYACVWQPPPPLSGPPPESRTHTGASWEDASRVKAQDEITRDLSGLLY